MFGMKKKCELCREEIGKGSEISESVEVYGRTDMPKRHFCSQEHLDIFKDRTAQLMKTRRPNMCTRC